MGLDNFISSEESDLISCVSEIEISENLFQNTTKIFANPLLLEKILTYLIFNKDNSISGKMVQTVRLVQKSWLEMATTVLKKSVKPFIVLTLKENNSKRLDQFVTRFGSTSRLQYSLLPFKLNLTLEYFRAENQESLSNCFTQLGKELIELEVTFPKDGGSMPLKFQQFTLPFLRKLIFQFSYRSFPKRDHDKPTFGNNKKGLLLLQLILHVSENIQELAIPCSRSNDDLVPQSFGNIRLPTTIVTLELREPLKDKSLKILLTNQLPKLKNLSLRLQKRHPIDNDMLFNILDRYRKTLKNFRVLYDLISGSLIHPRTVLRFPVMEQLTNFQVCGAEFELASENISCLQTFLPKLRQVQLLNQTEALLAKWIQNSKLENVRMLVVRLVNDEVGLRDSNYFKSVSCEMIKQIHNAVPNVINLSLNFNAEDLFSLRYVIRNMAQLKFFQIVLQGNCHQACRRNLYSILLGINVELVDVLAEHPEYLQSVMLNRSDEVKSITNLSELVLLYLTIKSFPPTADIYPEVGGMAFITDLIFTEGFLKMSNLRSLTLAGKFQASVETTETWKSQGRTIINADASRMRPNS